MEIRKTEIFVDWLDNLRDSRARPRIIARLDRMEIGIFGDVQPVGWGDKKTQHADIAKAKKLADKLEN